MVLEKGFSFTLILIFPNFWIRRFVFLTISSYYIKEALSVLMLCEPSNRRQPFSYNTKMADVEYFRVLALFS